jgi:hypothetical protein
MTNLPWIKLYTEIMADAKLYDLPDAQKWRFVQLLTLAGECDSEGYLISSGKPLATAYIAARFIVDHATLLADLQALCQNGLLVLDENTGAYLIPSFASRQSRPDDELRKYWRKQKRRSRMSQRTASQPEAEAAAAPTPAQGEVSQTAQPVPAASPQEALKQPPQAAASAAPAPEASPSGAAAMAFPVAVPGNVPDRIQELIPLKRRIEKKRTEKRQRKRGRGESPPPAQPFDLPTVEAAKAPSNSTSNSATFGLDQLERELAKQNEW